MARSNRKLLRPEDSTSWEEFQARCIVEQAQCRAANSSNKAIGQAILSGVLVVPGIISWSVVAEAAKSASWGAMGFGLFFALVFTGLFLRYFGRGIRRGFGGSKRYMELTRLHKEWQAKAERGEIPQTTPGGPKVWRDELKAGATGR